MNDLNFKEESRFDLIGFGRLCIDLNANEIHRPLEETITFTRYLGGSPANIIVASAKLGLQTGFIGRYSHLECRICGNRYAYNIDLSGEEKGKLKVMN